MTRYHCKRRIQPGIHPLREIVKEFEPHLAFPPFEGVRIYVTVTVFTFMSVPLGTALAQTGTEAKGVVECFDYYRFGSVDVQTKTILYVPTSKYSQRVHAGPTTPDPILPAVDRIRYLIDWNSDGSLDQIVPPSGYVPSGTQQDAERTYSVEGAKTVQVRAQDESGGYSAWTTLQFTCAAAAEARSANPDDSSSDSSGGSSGFITDTRGESGESAFLSQSCSVVEPCTGGTLQELFSFISQADRSAFRCPAFFSSSRCEPCPNPPCRPFGGFRGNLTATPVVRAGDEATVSWRAVSGTRNDTILGFYHEKLLNRHILLSIGK